jgi:hypothetical protein
MAGADPPTVYLHIGTPKSGTTYLQSRLVRNHDRAARQGLLWPGPHWGAHVDAARELVRLPDGTALSPGGPWSRMAADCRAWNGNAALISMEWMIRATPHQIRTAVESLEPCRVEVICTMRDLLRSVVAQWQEMTKNYRPWSWDQFVSEMMEEDPDGLARRTFWSQQDVPAILGRWLEVVSPDRVHLVSVPPSGGDPELLWLRFCDVLGVDGSGFEPPTQDNASLGVVSTVLMQRLNVDAARLGLSNRQYKQVVHNAVGRQVLAPLRKQEDPIGVRAEVDAWVRRRSEGMIKDISNLGIDVVGDLADLVPGPPLRGRDPGTVTESELLALCTEVVVALGVQKQAEIMRLRGRRGKAPGSRSAERLRQFLSRGLARRAPAKRRSCNGTLRRLR